MSNDFLGAFSGTFNSVYSFVAGAWNTTTTSSTDSQQPPPVSPPREQPKVKLDPHQVVLWLNRYPQIRESDSKARLAIDKENHLVYIQPGIRGQGGIRYLKRQSREDIKLLMVPLKIFAKLYLTIPEKKLSPQASNEEFTANATEAIDLYTPQADTGIVIHEDKKNIPSSPLIEAARKLLLGAATGLETIREFYKEQDKLKQLKEMDVDATDVPSEEEESELTKELNTMIAKVKAYCEESKILVSKEGGKGGELDIEGHLDAAWNTVIKRVWSEKYIITLANLFDLKEDEAVDAILKTRTTRYSEELSNLRI